MICIRFKNCGLICPALFLTDSLYQIIENIQNGSLKAGAALPAERTMAETMGVSRPAVREVLRALELLGIVKPVPGGGNYITEEYGGADG